MKVVRVGEASSGAPVCIVSMPSLIVREGLVYVYYFLIPEKMLNLSKVLLKIESFLEINSSNFRFFVFAELRLIF